MPQREKIILLIAAAALVYGIYAVFIRPSPKHPLVSAGHKAAEMKKLVSDVTGGLKKEELSAVEGYILKMAEAPWPSDPFYRRETVETPEAEEAVGEAVHFSYSGYLELGATRLAIINDKEYRAGEDLEEKGYTLLKILPERVIIQREQIKKQIIVPHQENAMTGEPFSKGDRG